jgi:cytoskeletal protein RodZ
MKGEREKQQLSIKGLLKTIRIKKTYLEEKVNV